LAAGSVFISFLDCIHFLRSIYPEHFERKKFSLFDWLLLPGTQHRFDFFIALTLIMLVIVTGVGFSLHVYSIGYMHTDEGSEILSCMNLLSSSCSYSYGRDYVMISSVGKELDVFVFTDWILVEEPGIFWAAVL